MDTQAPDDRTNESKSSDVEHMFDDFFENWHKQAPRPLMPRGKQDLEDELEKVLQVPAFS